MADSTQEIMVGFRAGLSEDAARKVAESFGVKVRRRMRTDSDEEVMLLVRVSGDSAQTKAKLDKHGDVTYTELNEGGFRPLND